MQAKDIDTHALLQFIYDRSQEPFGADHWTAQTTTVRWVWCWDFQCEPWSTYPWKVLVAKLKRLEARGFIRGCMCGCRMDIEVTERGAEFLGIEEPRLWGHPRSPLEQKLREGYRISEWGEARVEGDQVVVPVKLDRPIETVQVTFSFNPDRKPT